VAFFCYKWGDCNIQWNLADWTWSECQFVEELISEIRPGIPGEEALPNWLKEDVPYNPYDQEKRKKFIKLLCKINKTDYEEEKMSNKNIKISVNDVSLVIKKVSGIDIKIN
jgi:hypothetical protein